MQECVAWVRWRGGWPGFINIRTSSGRGQRKGCWPGTVEDPRDTSKCRWTSPRPSPLGKTKGETCTRSPMTGIRAWIRRGSRRGSGGHGGPEGEEENGGCRCAARWRREARWEEIQQAIVWRERTGADPRERQLRIIHQSLLTHTHTQKGMTDRVEAPVSRSSLVTWSWWAKVNRKWCARWRALNKLTVPANTEQ